MDRDRGGVAQGYNEIEFSLEKLVITAFSMFVGAPEESGIFYIKFISLLVALVL